MPEERLKLAVFIDFDNIQIGVKDTLGKEFEVSLVLESLKERGEVVAKVAYGDWSRAGDQSRQMTQHAIQMVQRSVTPHGDKNGADINLALDALEMAFTRHHINAFAIVGGDSDFMALVEKLKQFDKQVFVIGGRAFTSNILQRNCTEFIAYENLLKTSAGGDASRPARAARRSDAAARAVAETHLLSEAVPDIQRALKILADRGVAPQLGLLKSTLLQLDSTFSERDYGAGSFLEFMQKVERAGLVHLRRVERGFLVEPAENEPEVKVGSPGGESLAETEPSPDAGASPPGEPQTAPAAPVAEALGLLKQALAAAAEKSPGRPLYLRQLRQRLRAIDPKFDEQRYGFRGTLDLLHHAQREGLVRLQRDHKGIWRIHPQLAAGAEPPSASPQPEVCVEAPESAEPAATATPIIEAAPTTDSTGEEMEELSEAAFSVEFSEPVADARSGQEIEPVQPKARKSRPPKTAGRRSQRRPPSRRKNTPSGEA